MDAQVRDLIQLYLQSESSDRTLDSRGEIEQLTQHNQELEIYEYEEVENPGNRKGIADFGVIAGDFDIEFGNWKQLAQSTTPMAVDVVPTPQNPKAVRVRYRSPLPDLETVMSHFTEFDQGVDYKWRILNKQSLPEWYEEIQFDGSDSLEDVEDRFRTQIMDRLESAPTRFWSRRKAV